MHCCEVLGSLARFVRLQVADQVPPNVHVGRRRDFLQGLLHAVFAEIALAGIERRANSVKGEVLGDGDEADVGGWPSRARRRGGDARANLG